MELADKTCVERCRDGHTEDFSLLVGRYQGPLFAYLARRLGDRREAEEAAQESFVRAFLALRTLRQPEAFHTWLIGIAARVLKEQFRSTLRRERDRAAAQDWAEAARARAGLSAGRGGRRPARVLSAGDSTAVL